MKVINVNGIIKNIPKRYADGVPLIKESQLEAPDKKRLTPYERFLFAEAAWRSKQSSFVRSHLSDHIPIKMERQENRIGQRRYVVIYDEIGGVWSSTVVPRSVWRVCPKERKFKKLLFWL